MKRVFLIVGVLMSLHLAAQDAKEGFRGRMAKYLNKQNLGVLVDSVSCYVLKMHANKSGRIRKVQVFYESETGLQVMQADDIGAEYLISDILKEEKKLKTSAKGNIFLLPIILGHLQDGTSVDRGKILTHKGIEQLVHLLAIANKTGSQVLAPAVVNVEQPFY